MITFDVSFYDVRPDIKKGISYDVDTGVITYHDRMAELKNLDKVTSFIQHFLKNNEIVNDHYELKLSMQADKAIYFKVI